jgi:hypothetical protein
MSASTDLEAEINARLGAAERLLASAALVGDAAEHHFWRASRDLWVEGTVRGLREKVDESVVRTFGRAVTPPPGEGSISEDLPVELEAVRHGMAVLIGVRSQAAQTEPAALPGSERRGERLGP